MLFYTPPRWQSLRHPKVKSWIRQCKTLNKKYHSNLKIHKNWKTILHLKSKRKTINNTWVISYIYNWAVGGQNITINKWIVYTQLPADMYINEGEPLLHFGTQYLVGFKTVRSTQMVGTQYAKILLYGSQTWNFTFKKCFFSSRNTTNITY